jgi:hypothetical protein
VGKTLQEETIEQITLYMTTVKLNNKVPLRARAGDGESRPSFTPLGYPPFPAAAPDN